MRKVNYEDDKNTGNTATHLATDTAMDPTGGELQLAYEEGFASASGVSNETAETGGRIRHPENKDAPRHTGQVHTSVENENAGLADD